MVTYQLGGLTTAATAHPALRLLVPATALAAVAYGTLAWSGAPGGTGSAGSRFPAESRGMDGPDDGSPSGPAPQQQPGGDVDVETAPPPASAASPPLPALPALRVATGAALAPSALSATNLPSPAALAPSPPAPAAAPEPHLAASENYVSELHMNDATRALLVGTPSAALAEAAEAAEAELGSPRSHRSLDESEQEAIEQAVHSAFEQELEGMNTLVTQVGGAGGRRGFVCCWLGGAGGWCLWVARKWSAGGWCWWVMQGGWCWWAARVWVWHCGWRGRV